MSIFYDLLKKNAEDPKTENMVPIIGRTLAKYSFSDANYCGLSYKELLKHVDFWIKMFKDPKFTEQPIAGRRKYIVVDNSITSITAIIALLECDSIPVIIDAKNVPIISKRLLPYTEYGDLAKGCEVPDAAVEAYLKVMGADKKLEGEDKPGTKLIICSSGSESLTPHLKVLTEEELVNLPIQYGDDDCIFYSYVSCAHISGILTNLVNLLVHDNMILLTQGFDIEDIYFAKNMETFGERNFERKYTVERYFLSTANPELINLVFGPKSYYDGNYYDQIHIEGDELVVHVQRPDYQFLLSDVWLTKDLWEGKIKPNSVMLPRDIVVQLSKAKLDGVDLSRMKHIYMAGGVNSEDMVKAMREKIPSIPEGVFTNLYGSTEANGVICCCNEKDFRTCYIDVSDCESGKVRYTYDHKAFYEIENGAVTEIASPEDVFNYMPYLSASSERVPDVTIANAVDIMYKGKENGDLGVYIGDQLYVLGRKSELLKLKGKSYITNSLESFLSNEIQAEVFVTPLEDKGIQPYIKVDKLSDFKGILEKYYSCLAVGRNIKSFHVNPPVVIDDYIFEKSKISGKQPRATLELFAPYVAQQYEALKAKTAGIVGTALAVAPSFLRYNIQVAKDGCFGVRVRRRLTMPMDDVIKCFYKPILLDKDTIQYVPQPQIIFITQEHIVASNSNIVKKFATGPMTTVLNEAIKADNAGELSEKKYRDPKEAKSVDEIFEILRHNIMFDILRRYANKRSYESALATLTPEELERYQKGLPIRGGSENTSPEQKDPDDRDPR